ncbi:hypothetical protein BK652_04965 [Pseudomonas brassicacearum]|uniref:Uncharacterized protein n=1 Tax=Pseudomonas brassicacearum TaxID=930166 RepID=A0A423GFK1_9PSED|nr:hypothetical protein [Pseudomonas brassicacearum]ROM85930.1 hypothetical protein BK652_04965 [Pseudomonas brassicacearum]
MADVNPRPEIPALQPGDWIDLEHMRGAPLLSYIKFPGMGIGDTLWLNWQGCGAQGEAVDLIDFRVQVSSEGGYTPERGMPVNLPNELLQRLDQGWVLYSYAVGSLDAPNDPNAKGPESLRVFCYVGRHPEAVNKLPVPHIKESHDRSIDAATIGSSGAIAVIPPYQAMSVGDTVTFRWQGYFADSPEPVHEDTRAIRAEHVRQPLTFTVPFIEIIGIAGDYADVSYRVEYAGQSAPARYSESQQQRIDIVAPGSALLPAITVKDYTGGPINPGHYPDGLTLLVEPVYPDIQEDDWVVLYWTGSESAKSVTQALRVDPSIVDSTRIEFHIEPQWLAANSNGQVKVLYQYARAGTAQTAEPLVLEISKPLHLPAPSVEGATANGENQGTWPASTNGTFVTVPDTAEIGSGTVEVHWQGHPNGGRYITTTPVSGRRFQIPATAIAANMSTVAQGRYFPVFYRVNGEDSVHFNLLVTPLDANRYPSTSSVHITGNQMSRSSVPFTGADLVIESSGYDAWPFMAEGQLLTMEAAGISDAGPVVFPVRNALPVSEAEFRNKKITEKLPKSFLETLQLNEQFSLKARVSFDGGETFTVFRDTTVTLVR